MSENLKISIITASLNMGKYIEQNIISIYNQTYKNFEHIIMDGGSSDNTIDILTKYKHLIFKIEKDKGQSDAYNKALQLATGDLILCLNSDDYLLNNRVFDEVVNELKQIDIKKYSAFMGNLIVVNENGNKIDIMVNNNLDYTYNDLLNKLPVVIHPATLFNRKVLLQTNRFDTNLHYQMDYDIFLKVSKFAPIHSISINISSLRRHDGSKGCSDQDWKFSWELIKIRCKNGGSLFNKINFQPYKNVLFHIVGRRTVDYIKNNKVLYCIAVRLGITKLNKLLWYVEEF